MSSCCEKVDPRGNRTPNLRVWNPTRYHSNTSGHKLRVQVPPEVIFVGGSRRVVKELVLRTSSNLVGVLFLFNSLCAALVVVVMVA